VESLALLTQASRISGVIRVTPGGNARPFSVSCRGSWASDTRRSVVRVSACLKIVGDLGREQFDQLDRIGKLTSGYGEVGGTIAQQGGAEDRGDFVHGKRRH
jgi:hypothetical protein